MTTLEILRRGRERVAKGWCQYSLAQDANGKHILDTDAPEAVKWCALGAPGEGDNATVADAKSRLLQFANTEWMLSAWNNLPERTQAEVVSVFEKAIAAEQAAAP